jgi:hypothetical protein
VRSLQDLVNVFRGVRHQAAKMEEKVHQLALRQSQPLPEPRTFASLSASPDDLRLAERLKQMKAFVKHLTSR